MTPVKLPRFVMFKGDNGKNLCLFSKERHPYLCFNSTNRDKWGSHEVIPVSGKENVVMVRSLYNNNFWRLSPSRIWADQSCKPTAYQLDCFFEVVQLSPTSVALKCLGNNKYVRRLTTEGKTDALNAWAGDNCDVSTRMEVSEALSSRRVFDVKYLTDQTETTDKKPVVLGNATAKNASSSNADVTVSVTYDVSESSTWSNSMSFATGFSVTVTAGIPDIASASGAVSEEFTCTTEMGVGNEKITISNRTVTLTFAVIASDVKPQEVVTMKVLGIRATGTVPYTYKFQDTLLDGTNLPGETTEDGVFEGVQVVNIRWEASNSSGTDKSITK